MSFIQSLHRLLPNPPIGASQILLPVFLGSVLTLCINLSPAMGQASNAPSLGVYKLFSGMRTADVCAAAAVEAERILRVPAHLMQAIALTESGRWDAHDERRKPWPWAVGSRGESWYFDSRAEAIEHVEKLQKQGTNNIDVGCMQINLYYHAKAFDSLQEVFNPINNVAYAGIFLSELHRLKQSWTEAVKFYHSATPKFHRRYVKVVFQNWQKLHDQTSADGVALGIAEDIRAPLVMPKLTENISPLLPENEENKEIQSIMQQETDEEKSSFTQELLRYDAFARVQAIQRLERQFNIDSDSVPPPLNAQEVLKLQ